MTTSVVTATVPYASYYALVTDYTSPAAQILDASSDMINKDEVDYVIEFEIKSPIPEGGTIQIIFPNEYAVVYPNCRSVISNGSNL